MTKTIRAAAFAAAALCGANAAAAQNRPVVSLSPAEQTKWDLAGTVGWLGSYKPDIGDDWNDWYDAPSASVTAGYYFTPHFKADLQPAISRQGRIFSQEAIPVPGGAFPVYRPQEHFFGAATVSAGVSRQFFENQWFHPFVSGGLEVVREKHRIETPQYFIPGRPNPGANPAVPVPPQNIPATTGPTNVSWAARPYVAAGVKLYAGERGFVRSDLRSSFSNRGPEHIVWSGGVGFDF